MVKEHVVPISKYLKFPLKVIRRKLVTFSKDATVSTQYLMLLKIEEFTKIQPMVETATLISSLVQTPSKLELFNQ